MAPTKDELSIHDWHDAIRLPATSYQCAYCSRDVTSDKGWTGHMADPRPALLCICPNCNGPTLFYRYYKQFPAVAPGSPVAHLPIDLEQLFAEARNAAAAYAYTGAVMLCRKVLMSIAVEKGAVEGLRFIEYVDFLESKGYVPPGGKGWIDAIRKQGNDANHRIAPMSVSDAETLIDFTAMLLRIVYEFPARGPQP